MERESSFSTREKYRFRVVWTRSAKKISIYGDPIVGFRYKVSDSRFVRIYYWFRIHLAARANIFEADVREREPGDETREVFQATRKLPSIPPRRRFSDGFFGELHPRHFVRSGRREISSMEINFRSTGATGRALVCARVSTWCAEHFRSHAPIARETR